jgi:alkylation response protein AidB-like acyl-CoA dehydrogenase
MNMSLEAATLHRLRAALVDLDPLATPAQALRSLVQRGLDRLPMPGSGATLQRWQALAAVAAHDLSLAKLYEGHTDALAIMAELGNAGIPEGATFGTWAAEAPSGRTTIETGRDGRTVLNGAKCWCSGAADLSHGLLTAWHADGRAPQLVRVVMNQPGVATDSSAWQAVGMAGSASIDVSFAAATGDLVGGAGDYLSRPGFWQGGAGIAACWYGGALALGTALRGAVIRAPVAARGAFRLCALGKIDLHLQATAAVLRDAACWIDAHPHSDASAVALRARLAAEACAHEVLDEAGRALGAGAFCRDARFARMAADLPVFVRQSHAERDFAALGERAVLDEDQAWSL